MNNPTLNMPSQINEIFKFIFEKKEPDPVVSLSNEFLTDWLIPNVTNDQLFQIRNYFKQINKKYIILYREYLHQKYEDIQVCAEDTLDEVVSAILHKNINEVMYLKEYICPFFELETLTESPDKIKLKLSNIMNQIYGRRIWAFQIAHNIQNNRHYCKVIITNYKVYASNFFNDIKNYVKHFEINWINISQYKFTGLIQNMFSLNNIKSYDRQVDTKYHLYNDEYNIYTFKKSLIIDNEMEDITNREPDPIVNSAEDGVRIYNLSPVQIFIKQTVEKWFQQEYNEPNIILDVYNTFFILNRKLDNPQANFVKAPSGYPLPACDQLNIIFNTSIKLNKFVIQHFTNKLIQEQIEYINQIYDKSFAFTELATFDNNIEVLSEKQLTQQINKKVQDIYSLVEYIREAAKDPLSPACNTIINVKKFVDNEWINMKNIATHTTNFIKSLNKPFYSHQEIQNFGLNKTDPTLGNLIHYVKIIKRSQIKNTRIREYSLIRLDIKQFKIEYFKK
jgi:hypothetical protein